MNFYNTIQADSRQTSLFEVKAITQGVKILQFFKSYPNHEFTAEEIHEIVFPLNHHNIPITSIRRAMTNLANKGKLVKTGNKRRGNFGKPINTWKLA